MKPLTSLSDQALVDRLRTLVQKEQTLTLEILPHLVEVIRRGLHLCKGYGSLYEYCKGELGYTDASAWRRTRAAQAIVRCPEALDRLREGRVNLCTLSRVHKFLTSAILREICGRSKAEVELIAAAYDVKGISPDRTRPVMVPRARDVRLEIAGPTAAPGTVVDRTNGEITSVEHGQAPSLRSEVDLTNVKLSFEQKWKIEGVVSKKVKEKLDRCKMLLSRKYPQGVDYDILFDELAEVFLERVDPQRKRQKSRRRQAKPQHPPRAESMTRESRHITAEEKENVWNRDKGRCTYVGSDGKRCDSTHSLQYDHYPIPFARGGPSKASNLRLLCAHHNRYTAEKTFGKREHRKSQLQASGNELAEKHTRPLE
jgi:5-methylcytosine-specific restriction endonuclease McrA